MAKYTIRLDEVCNYLYNGKDEELSQVNFANDWGIPYDTTITNPFEDKTDVDEIIANVRTKIFDFKYPIYKEEHREELETKIIKHYYMREIGFETWGRFKLALNERMNLIMPYFNDLYKSIELNGDNPLVNTEIVEKRVTDNEGSTTSNSTATDNTQVRQKFEDTPTSELGNEDYATNITTNTSDSTNNYDGKGTNENKETMERHLTGLNAYSKQDMIARYRENIINVDEGVINELYDLFMLIY